VGLVLRGGGGLGEGLALEKREAAEAGATEPGRSAQPAHASLPAPPNPPPSPNKPQVNAAEVGDEPLGEWFHVAGMLLPLYAPRAAELEAYGPDGASLATALPLADAFELAFYCVRNSQLHPRFRSLPPLHTYVYLGYDQQWSTQRDPLAVGMDEELG
jgi:hypothetical protein